MENTNTKENCVADGLQPGDAVLLAHLAIDDAAQEKKLSGEEAERLKTLCSSICAGEMSSEVITTMLLGLRHDAEVASADAEGYLRGKNEKISALYHFSSDSQFRAQRNAVVPRFAHRSIWDIE